MEMLRVAQRKMERIMLGITLRDRKRNSWIRLQTGVTDIITAVNTAKHRWAGHVARLQDNRWTLRATEWTPGNGGDAEDGPVRGGGTVLYNTWALLGPDAPD
ncbi:hypothetical protein Bbelb_123980 [Branchiostoma belcheri]|nr:hypothetical protein Bbelb_123980 [Branchiostoma belcheri]